MKRKLITWLLLLSTCTLYACGKGENPANDPAGQAGTEQEPVIKEEQEAATEPQQEKLPETEQAPAPTITDNGVYENFTWDDNDLLIFGLGGLEKFKQQEPVVYGYTEAEKYALLKVEWDGTDDFDAITQYTEAFFELTTNVGGGNYSKVYNNDLMIYVADQSYATFEDLCNDQSWNTEDGNNVDGFFIQWYYPYGDREVRVTVDGEYNEKHSYMGFGLQIR